MPSTDSSIASSVANSGTFAIGDATVHRLGFGGMRLTGPGIWGEPTDRDEAVAVVRRAVELGVDFIDTADSYGPTVSEEIIAEALHPYPKGVLIATKAGLTRSGPNRWYPVGQPAYLRQQAELSLRRLKLERIELFQLHRIDQQVPVADQIGELKKLQDEGKIASIGLSEVSVEQIKAAREIADIVTVQNRYNVADRAAEDVLDYCEAEGIGFIPWAPIASGKLAEPGGTLDVVAARVGAKPSQVALAWLLARSPVMLPIPGTSRVAHLEENLAAASITLTAEQRAKLDDAAVGGPAKG